MVKKSGEMEKKLQEKYLEFQVIGVRIKKLREHLDAMDEQCVDLNLVINSLDDFRQSRVGSEILVPVNNGIFAKAELKDNNELIVNVGGEICVAKTVGETKELLDSRLRDMVDERNRVALQLQNLGLQVQEIEEEVTRLASES